MADNIYPHTTTIPAPASFESQDSFEVSDFFELADWIDDDAIDVVDPPLPSTHGHTSHHHHHHPVHSSNEIFVNTSDGISISSSSFLDGPTNRDMIEAGAGKEKKEIREKVAFKTKSEVEVLEDGFKWRKYGKKMVKNSPNPRNYYRCSIEGCPVKKRVERDKEDPRYVVTTYEGIHNHLHAGAAQL